MFGQRSSQRLQGTFNEVLSTTDVRSGTTPLPATPGSHMFPANSVTPGGPEDSRSHNSAAEGKGKVVTGAYITPGATNNSSSNNNNYETGDLYQFSQNMTEMATAGRSMASSHVTVGVLDSNENELDGFSSDVDGGVETREEKDVEYVTPGGPELDQNNNGNETDTSQSSEAEMAELRNQIVAQSIAKGVTPGGPDTNGMNISNNINNNNNNDNERRESVEMGIALAELMVEKERMRAKSKHEQDQRDSKFGKMLSDNLAAMDMITDDIVNVMNSDREGGGMDNIAEGDENEYVTPGGD